MTEENKREIANKVCWTMKDKGITFSEMVELSGVSIATLSHIRTAQWEGTFRTLEKVGNALGLKLVVKLESI